MSAAYRLIAVGIALTAVSMTVLLSGCSTADPCRGADPNNPLAPADCPLARWGASVHDRRCPHGSPGSPVTALAGTPRGERAQSEAA